MPKKVEMLWWLMCQMHLSKRQLNRKKRERVIMKIREPLLEMLIELDGQKYEPFITNENGNKILYVTLLKALYGMLQSALLY
jgi:hypothetical protein